ncbi:cupin domain-containing protein [Jiangella muralis]|uniref:cupin domain-containing protein n=1 Tax=Jiangella muralis TaxID=702383 RepID=UPI001F0A350F|nr:hypothetical protein [Jiangella muralis]
MGTLPLDRFPVLRTKEPAEFRAAVSTYMGEHPIEVVEVTPGLDVTINGRLIDRAAVSYVALGAEARTEPYELGCYLVQTVVTGACLVQQDDQQTAARAGDTVVLSPQRSVRSQWTADCGVVAYVLRESQVTSHLSRLLGRPVTRPLRFDLVTDRGSAIVRAFVQGLLRPLTRQLNRDRSLFDQPVVARRVEDTLITGLLRAQPNSYSDALEQELGRLRT